MAVETLSLPFPSWRWGPLALVSALEDPDRERIVVDRPEATAAASRSAPSGGHGGGGSRRWKRAAGGRPPRNAALAH